jgi:hypothetical protein
MCGGEAATHHTPIPLHTEQLAMTYTSSTPGLPTHLLHTLSISQKALNEWAYLEILLR